MSNPGNVGKIKHIVRLPHDHIRQISQIRSLSGLKVLDYELGICDLFHL